MLAALTIRWLVHISTSFAIIIGTVVVVSLAIFALRPLLVPVAMVEFFQLLDWQVFIAVKLIRVELLLRLIDQGLPGRLLVRTVGVQVATFGDADASLVRIVRRRGFQRPNFIGKVHFCRQRVIHGRSFAITFAAAVFWAILLVEGLAQMRIQLHVVLEMARGF